MAGTSTRKAELTKFFDLFERLTNRALRKSRAQEQVTSVAAEASKPFAMPGDLALPAIRNLSSIASNRRTCQQQTVHKDEPENSNTNSVVEEITAEEDRKEAGSKILAGSWYPFTFKMMLHKLYELEEWARKVKETLEKSREDYRSLSDLEKKGNDESYQRRRTQAKPNDVTLGSDPAGVHAHRHCGADDSAFKKRTPVPKSSTNENGKKHDDKAIKKCYVGRPKIVTTVQDGRFEGSQAAAITGTEGVLCLGYSSEDCSFISGVVTSMVGEDSDRNSCNRLGYTRCSTPDSELDGNTSCTAAHRKRPLCEAESTYPGISPRKRPFLR